MKMKNFAMSLFFFSLLPSLLSASDSINIALIATPATSFVSGWEDLDAVNDGFIPANSNDKSHGAYGNWSNPNSLQWVEYQWNSDYIIKSVEIYWFDDNGGVLTPTTAYLEYAVGDSWQRSVDVPCEKNSFNYASLGSIRTNRLRVLMLNPEQSTGILEFRVWGTNLSGGTDIEAPSSPGKPELVSESDTSLTLRWAASVDNDSLAGYRLYINDTSHIEVSDTFATVKDLLPGKHYMFAVSAFDASYNYSGTGPSLWLYFGPESSTSEAYDWPAYYPTLDYDFRDEFPGLDEPTMDLEDCDQAVGRQSSGWWTFVWGPNKRHEVTEAAITPMLERLNKDFAYFRDTLGWPPDKRAKEGYRSAVYLFGSGLSCIDNADTTALGGWQSGINGYACILASYYPVYSFDPDCPYGDREFQMGAMVHEGIHSVLADLPGCKKAAWFHEGGNTWLQQEAEARRSGDFSQMGFLNAGAFIAPFMPVECYSGWLQDGSFGGPSAEGVNRYNENGQQLCTWRNLLGGTQYGNAFPTALGIMLGEGSVPWIWRNCPGRVLEGMAEGLGEMQLRRLLMEYRARQALVDMGQWSPAVKRLLDANFGNTIRAEYAPKWIECTNWKATPYVKTWMLDSSLRELTPEPRTTPGWSGANQIPLNVEGDTVGINFIPLGRNMSCQLCYRATDGTAVYSQPVFDGYCSLALDKEPANGVVIVVICNTDYIYEGEETRMAHFDYRIQLVKGISGKASIYRKWYDYSSVIEDASDPVEPFPTEGAIYVPEEPQDTTHLEGPAKELDALLYPNPVRAGETVNLEFSGQLTGEKEIHVFNMQGQLVYTESIPSGSTMQIPASALNLAGIYIIRVRSGMQSGTYKLILTS